MQLMGKIFKGLLLSCADTSTLLSKMMDKDLSFTDWLKVKLHLSMCQICNFYKNQLQTIRSLTKKLASEDALKATAVRLSPEAREKIKHSLKQEQ